VEELTRSDLTEENIKREKELVAELEKLLEQEETYWAQRSRVNWLKLGDKKIRVIFISLHQAGGPGIE
jgi:molybdopterin converting factor small subunit